MIDKTLIWKGKKLFSLSKKSTNPYHLAGHTPISYPRLLRLFGEDKAPPHSIGFSTLYIILSLGFGLSDDEILNLRLGDLVDLKDTH
jgi:hypothetical protein